MLERAYMYMPKICEDGHTCFETWLKHVKKDSHALKHNEKGLHVLKDVKKGYTFWIKHETCITCAKNDLHILKHGWNMSRKNYMF